MAKEILKNDIDVRGAYTSSNAQVIEVNSATTALRVTQRGTGNCLVVEDSTSTDITPFVINQYGSVGVGLIPTNDPITSGPRLTVNGDFSTSSINTEASNDIAFIKANQPTEPPFTNNNYKKYIYSGPGGYVDFMGGYDGVSQNSVVFNFSDAPIFKNNYDDGSTVTVNPFTVAYIQYDGSSFYTLYTKNLYPPTIDSQIINANSTSSALRITQIGTGNALVVEDSTNPDSTAFVITSSGNVGVGTLSPIEKLTVVGNISASGNINSGSQFLFADGTISAPAIANIGDTNNGIYFPTTDTLGFVTNGAERLRITDTGELSASRNVHLTTVTETKATPSITSNVLTLDLSIATLFYVNLNAPITTFTLTNVPASPKVYSFTLQFVADGTLRAVTWPTGTRWSGGTAPTLTSTLNKVDTFTFLTHDGGTNWFAYTSNQNQ